MVPAVYKKMLKKDDDLTIAELLSVFANIALPVSACISHGVANIINNKQINELVMNELSNLFGEDLTADELSDCLGSR